MKPRTNNGPRWLIFAWTRCSRARSLTGIRSPESTFEISTTPEMKIMTTSAPHPYLTALMAVASLIAGGVLTCGMTPAWAQSAKQAPPNFLALGVALVPEFEGSSDRSAVPALIGRLVIGSTTLRLLGNSAQWSLLPANSPWALGPALSLRSSRDEDVEDALIKRLRPIDATVGAGVFAEYSWSSLVNPSDNFTAGFELLGGKAGAHAALSLFGRFLPAMGLAVDLPIALAVTALSVWIWVLGGWSLFKRHAGPT